MLFPTKWLYIGAGGLVLALALALFVQTERLDRTRTAFTTYKASVVALGEQAQRDAEAQAAKDRLNKDAADAAYERLKRDHVAAVKRMRQQPGSGAVPPAPAGSLRPELACYDRPIFERAYGDLVAGVRVLADEGTEATVGLNTARNWARPPR